MRKNLNLFAGGTLAGVVLLSGCVVHEHRRPVVVREPVYAPAPPPPGEVVVTQAPPAPLVEVQPPAPGGGYVWVPGNWAWRGQWAWEQGYWTRPPRPGVAWVPHRYVYRNGVHVWVRGHWR